MDSTQKLKYEKSKYILKKWESEFKKTMEKLPTKIDIKCAPKKIKDAYKTYWTLKKYLSGSEKSYNIHEDENAKDCFNSSSETGDKEISFKNDIDLNITNASIGLDDSICFQAVSETLTQSNCNFPFQNEKDILKKTPDKSESLSELTLDNGNKHVTELTPTSFKNLFSKQERTSVIDSSLVDKVDLEKSDGKIEKKKFEAKSLSFQYAEKLYAGSKFNKRNPRKPRSFSNPKNPETIGRKLVSKTSNNAISKTLSEVDFNALQPKENHLSDFSHCGSLTSPPTVEDNGMLEYKEKFKIVTQSLKVHNQPVSLLQRSVDSSNSINHSVSRIIDKGWLERVTESSLINKKLETNLAESQDSGISSIKTDSLSDTINITSPESKPYINDDSSDDLIYDSDCETQSNSLYKLNLLNTLNRSTSTDAGILKTFSKKLVNGDSATKSSDLLEKTFPKSNGNDFIADVCVNISNETSIPDRKRSLIEDLDDMPLAKRLKSDTEYCFQSITKPEIILPYKNSKKKLVTKEENVDHKQEMLEKKIASGDANKNFVKINIEKKRYARGKKTITFSKYKKQKWKDMQKYKSTSSSGIIKCYKCGDVGHFSKACPKKMDELLPIEEYDSADDSPFPTLEEAAEMAKEAAETAHKHGRKFTIPEGVVSEIPIISEPCHSTIIQPLFKLSPDGSLIDTPEEVYSALKDLGHSEFRPGQEEGIMRILSGLSTIVTLSTGSGKSLIYQLPAYMYNKAYPGCITLVISPLVSLMEDQIFCGSKKLHAACLHHNMTQKKREAVLEALKNKTISVLLIAPESLSSWDSAKSLLKILPPIAFACIDEAHSISQHSHNFRPTYLTICQVIKEKLGVSTLLGLTATASVSTLETVMSQLGIDDTSSIISDTPLPDNLFLTVSSEYDRREALLTLLHSKRFCDCDSVIVYCTRREECDKIAAFLRASLQDATGPNKKGRLSIHAEAYHAGLTAGRRNQVQSAFMSGKLRIVVATVAFGMGINKNDIRGIIHYNMPYSFESYVQEIGRAGRDKKPAECHLFLDSMRNDLNELRRHIYADTMDRHTIRKLLQLVFIPCDCGKKITSNPSEVSGLTQSSQETKDNQIVCCKHEVAFPVENTIISLDLPQEVISTLLAYLQLDKEKWIKVLPYAYTKCKVTSYKGAKHLKKIAKNCAPLAMAIAEESDNFNKAFIEFDIVKLARKINWDSGTVKHYLKQLEWTTVEDKPRKTGIIVEFSCLGFRVLAPGNLRDFQLDQALNLLHSKVISQEEMKIKQLSLFYGLLKKVAYNSIEPCCDSIDIECCNELKNEIRKYFRSSDPLSGINIVEEEIEDEYEVAGDIRRLISTYRSDNNFTGRNIAKILHGIGSPNFPAIVWGRTKFWRLHLDQDFNSLVALANKQLILMR